MNEIYVTNSGGKSIDINDIFLRDILSYDYLELTVKRTRVSRGNMSGRSWSTTCATIFSKPERFP